MLPRPNVGVSAFLSPESAGWTRSDLQKIDKTPHRQPGPPLRVIRRRGRPPAFDASSFMRMSEGGTRA
jgi:hypothetical protein